MNSKERWIATLQRKPVDRVPFDMWATNEVFEKLCKHFSCQMKYELFDKLEIDTPYIIGPRYIGPELKPGFDIWGVKYKKVDYGTGIYNEAVYAPLGNIKTLKDIKDYNWPNADNYDYSNIRIEVKKNSHRPIQACHIEPFLLYSRMRGLEQAMMDLVENLELVDCAFNFMFDFVTRQFERILENADGRVDITLPSEDLGSQTGPLFSLEIFRRLHKPRFKKYIDLAHQANVFTFFHSDGACRDFIPELIEIGVDILNPIQWNCLGMDREGLKKDFGESLIFHGGVENQSVLPFGTPEDVRKEVRECFDTLGVNGGYICAPCHNIQPNTPLENILAMYEEAQEYGRR